MKKVYDNAMKISKYLNWDRVICYDEKGMKSIEDIQSKYKDSILQLLSKKVIIENYHLSSIEHSMISVLIR